MTCAFCVKLVVGVCVIGEYWSLLYPRDTKTRQLRSLDGVWSFRTSPETDPDAGFKQQWYRDRLAATGSVINMPVPSSFNDITTERKVRDYIGWLWYERSFFVPRCWSNERVVLRFGSVNYYAIVYVNGELVTGGAHEGGHLPFEMEIGRYIRYDSAYNWITVAVNNTLNPHTIPQGHIVYKEDKEKYPPDFFEQTYNFGYFHYAGIHRSVHLFTTPKKLHITDVRIATNFSGTPEVPTAHINYLVTVALPKTTARRNTRAFVSCQLKVRNSIGVIIERRHVRLISKSAECRGLITIDNATLWWPYRMHQTPGQMHELEVTAVAADHDGSTLRAVDHYHEPFGIRTVSWDNERIYINGKQLYMRGFGKHEDANIVGRGLHLPMMVRDINLLLWSGANIFRTSHYPYAEELLDLTDQAGILVIAESPAIGLQGFDDELLNKHKTIMNELIDRDKNRASVIMWSLGNEPQSSENASGPYFQKVYEHTRWLDETRPITSVLAQPYSSEKAAQFMDVILINRYFSWYTDSGRTEVIRRQMIHDLHNWRRKFQKPVGVSEYGAGSVVGLRDLPEFIWTEDYQAVFLKEYFRAFDHMRQYPWFMGEMIWNFADFAMPPEFIRPQFCMKGVFTRERKPKLVAYIVRDRYMSIEN